MNLPDPLPCPFCGRQPSLDHPDTLYPNGGGWKQQDGFRSYHSFREVPSEQWCYGMHCDESCGGCGAEITGDSAAEAVERWNRRTYGAACVTATNAARVLRDAADDGADLTAAYMAGVERGKDIGRAACAAGVPLNDVKLLSLARQHLDKGLSWAPHITRCTDLEIRAFARAIERAHGIGAGGSQG